MRPEQPSEHQCLHSQIVKREKTKAKDKKEEKKKASIKVSKRPKLLTFIP